MAPRQRKPKTWSIDDKVRVLAEARRVTGTELTALLEKEGLLLAELEQWRLALDEEGRASIAMTKRIRRLERELARKEKALSEAAALLVIKEGESNTCRRTRTTTLTRGRPGRIARPHGENGGPGCPAPRRRRPAGCQSSQRRQIP